MYDYLVVGSGLYGATFAQQAKAHGKSVLVIDKRPNIAGNIYTEKVEGINFHKYGAHIFHTNNKEVWDYLQQFTVFNRFTNSPVANYKGELYSMPFNMYTFNKMWGVVTPEEAQAKIDEQRKEITGEPQNLEEQAISLVGRDIYEKLVKGYTEKQWGRDCKDLPAFIIKRLPVRLTFDNNYFNALYQGIPIGGYTKMVEHMLDGIEVRLGVDYLEHKDELDALAVKVIYLEDMKIPEIARALEAQGVPSPQIQMAKKKRSRTKIKWPDSTIRLILKNPLYIGKCTLTLAKAKRELEVPAIVSKTEFQKAQKKLESTRLPSRKKARKKTNLLFKKIYDKESGKGLLCRTSEDESRQVYSFDKGYKCFSGKAPFIESEKIFREILSALEKEKMQAAHIDRVLDLNPEKVKQCMDAGLLQYRKRANEIVAHLMAKDDERIAVYREYEQGSISLEQVEEYEHQYQVAIQKQEAAFKKVMLAVNDIEKAFSHGNPWLMKFRAISIPEKLERTHLKEWLDHVWIVDFEQVEVILQESEWKGFFPEEWLNNGEEDFNGKKE